MGEYTTLFERAAARCGSPSLSTEALLLRRDRKRRYQRIAAGVVGIAVFVAAVWIVATAGPFDRAQTPAAPGPTGSAEPTTTVPAVDSVSPRVKTAPWYTPTASEMDYVIDLNSGEMTPLPQDIIRLIRDTAWWGYAASPDGSTLAFVGMGEEGTPQIFIAGIDGTGVRQVTHHPTRATSPAWSPDGTLIAYVGHGGGGVSNVYVLDLATGEAAQITDGIHPASDPQFMPDGQSVLYTAGNEYPIELRTAPLGGGESALLFGPTPGIRDSGNGSMSPDASLVTFLGDCPSGGGPCRYLANADGTNPQVITGWMANPAGTWSPDGSRIVAMEQFEQYEPKVIVVIDVATEAATIVARGRAAIWLDDHTLLVSA